MHRRWFAAALAAALLLVPTTALAQTADDGEGPTDEVTSPLDVLASFLAGLVETFGVDLDADPVVDESTLDEQALEDLEQARATLDAIVDALTIEFTVQAALDEAEELEGEEGEELDGEGEGDEAGDNHGQIVRTVAHCAPRGQAARGWLEGVNNHGQFVSTVARGGSVGVYVPTISVDEETGTGTVTEATEATTFEFTSVADAEAFCDAMATIQLALDLQSGLDGELSDKELRQAERDARKAERDARKAERMAERDARKAARGAGRPDRG